MKKTLIISLLIAITAGGAAAAGPKSLPAKQATPQIKRFLSRKGRLTIIKYIEKGAVLGEYSAYVTCDAVLIYSANMTKPTVKGLRISVIKSGEYGKQNHTFLDVAEAKSLAKALDYMISLAGSWRNKDQNYTEVTFATKDDFRVGFYQQHTTQKAFTSAGTIGKTNCFFPSIDSLQEFRQVIQDALKTLQQY